MDRRQRLIEIFEDTQRFYSQNTQLSKAAQAANAAMKLYEENAPLSGADSKRIKRPDCRMASYQQEVPVIQVK